MATGGALSRSFQLVLESKRDMTELGIKSPDKADALAMRGHERRSANGCQPGRVQSMVPRLARALFSLPGVQGFRRPTSSGCRLRRLAWRRPPIDLLLHSHVTPGRRLGQSKMNRCPRCNGLITLEPPDERIGERRPYYHCKTCGWEESVEPPPPKPIPGKKPPLSRA